MVKDGVSYSVTGSAQQQVLPAQPAQTYAATAGVHAGSYVGYNTAGYPSDGQSSGAVTRSSVSGRGAAKSPRKKAEVGGVGESLMVVDPATRKQKRKVQRSARVAGARGSVIVVDPLTGKKKRKVKKLKAPSATPANSLE